MPFLTFPQQPWCTGRSYPNGASAAKVRTVGRNPPYFWIIECHNFESDSLGFNGLHTLHLNRVATGADPYVEWAHNLPWFTGSQMVVEWDTSPFDASKKRLTVNLRYGSSESERRIWALTAVDYTTDWMQWDNATPGLEYSAPGWSHGATAFVQMKIGLYSRLPAHSCIGDYNGPWP